MNSHKVKKQGRSFWGKISNFKQGKTIPIWFLVIGASFFFVLSSSFAAEGIPQFKLQADHFEWSQETSSIVGWGNVSLEYEDISIKADNIKVNLETSDLLAEGEVRIQLKERVVEGKDLEYNLKRKEGMIQSPRGKEGSFFYRAKEAYLSSETIELREVNFTTCNLSPPHYSIRMGNASIRFKEEITMKNIAFYYKGLPFPVFWVPYFVQYIRKENRVIFPVFGYSKFAGLSIQTGYNFYASPSFQTKFHLDYRTKKGWAQGIDVSYRLKIGGGELDSYFTREIGSTEGRWAVRLRHQYTFSPSTYLKLRLERVSDENFLTEYFNEEYKTSYLYIGHQGTGYNMGVLMEPAVNLEFETNFIERLPQIQLNFGSQRIGESRLYSEKKMEITNFRKEEKSIIRADGFLDFSFPFTLLDEYLRIRPKLGYHLFYYWYEKEGENLEAYRSIPYQELSLVSEIENQYGNYTHIVRPSLSYYHSSEIKNDFELPFELKSEKYEQDYEKRTGEIHPQNLIKFNFANYLYSGKRRVMTGEIKTSCDLTKKEEKFSPLEGKFLLNPSLPLIEYFDFSFLYHFYEKKYKEVKVNLGLKSSSWNMKLGVERYIDGQASTDIITQGNFKVGEKWEISGYLRYNLEKKNIQEEVFSLQRDLHCWAVRLFLKEKPEREYWIGFYIKALPQHWIRYHPMIKLLEIR